MVVDMNLYGLFAAFFIFILIIWQPFRRYGAMNDEKAIALESFPIQTKINYSWAFEAAILRTLAINLSKKPISGRWINRRDELYS